MTLSTDIKPTSVFFLLNIINFKYTDVMSLPIFFATFTVLVGILGSLGHSAACLCHLQIVEPQQVMTGLAGCFITLNFFGHARLGSVGCRACYPMVDWALSQ